MEFKGFTYGFAAKRGMFRSKEGIKSQELLYQTGINWLCLAVVLEQETAHSTKIEFDFGANSSDRDIIAAVERAHKNNIKVCLKPMVNCKDGVWRAYINFADSDFDGNDIYWDKWFKSYSDFMIYYAELAEETGCEMLCIGCEMCGTERKEKHWRKLIADIRKVYSGKLVYNTNHGHEDDVKWFDAVDYVGTSAYFPVAKEGGATSEMMKQAWLPVRDEMYKIHRNCTAGVCMFCFANFCNHLVDECVDGLVDLMSHVDCFQHLCFGNFVSACFDHDNLFHGGSNGQLQIALLPLFLGRVNHEFAVYQTDLSHCAGAVEGNVGNGGCDRRTQHCYQLRAACRINGKNQVV